MTSLMLEHNITLTEWKDAVRLVADIKKRYAQLKDNLYNIIDKKETDPETFSYTIAFIPECEIYRIHFPGNPVTPGTCLVETGRELFESHLDKRLNIKTINGLKIMIPVNPLIYPEVEIKFNIKQNDPPLPDLHECDITVVHRDEILASMNLVMD